MNRKLLASKKLPTRPEVIEEFFDYGFACCCAFNRPGTLLATGTDDGLIGIWDLQTRGLAKVLPGHRAKEGERPTPLPSVTSVAWSRSGRHLLSGAKDGRIILWEVLSERQVCEVRLASPVTHVCLSARPPFTAVVSLSTAPPVVVDLASQQVTPLLSVDLRPPLDSSGGQQQLASLEELPAFALLSKSGREVFVGQQRNKGLISVYDTGSRQLLDVVKLPGSVKVLSMCLNQGGGLLLVNCSDKVLRMADVRPRPDGAAGLSDEQALARLAQVQPGRTGSLLLGELRSVVSLAAAAFHNAVEKSSWGHAVLSRRGRHVSAAVARANDCRVYVWERLSGKLAAILEGPRNEGIVDMAWHPTAPQMVSVSTNGKVYIWAPIHNEDWSAFAPDFQELDENQEYVEAEDEFDANKRASPLRAPHDSDAEEGAGVDVITREHLLLLSSDEEEEEEDGRRRRRQRRQREGGEQDDDDEEEEEDAPLLHLPAYVDLGAEEDDREPDGGTTAAGDLQQSSADAEGDEAAAAAGAAAAAAAGGGDAAAGGDGAPRERKRRVRFESAISGADDDEAFEELVRQEEEASRQQAAARGRGRGRRGRPPSHPRPPADGEPAGTGGRGAAGSGLRPFGGSGSLLNPADAGQHGSVLPGGAHMQDLLQHQLQLQRQQFQQQQQRQGQGGQS